MMAAALIAICCFGLWFAKVYRDVMRDKRELEIEGAKSEAEKVVKSKTAGDLIDDFNKRYSDSNGKG